MGIFNNLAFKRAQALLKKAGPAGAYVQNFDIDEEEAAQPSRSVRLQPHVGPAANPVGRGRSYDDFDNVSEPLSEWEQESHVSPKSPGNAITHLRQEVEQWLASAASDPSQPTPNPQAGPAKMDWLDNRVLDPAVPQSVPALIFARTVEQKLRSLRWPEQAVEQFILSAQRQARAAAGFQETQEEDASVSLPHSMEAQEPTTQAFTRMMDEKMQRDPMVRQLLGLNNVARFGPEKLQAMSDAIATAFGSPFDQKLMRNEVRFFTTQENVKFLPAALRKQVEPFAANLPKDRMAMTPEQGRVQSQMTKQEPMRSAISKVVSLLSQPENLKAVQNRLQALFLSMTAPKTGAAEHPEQQAATLDPEAAQMMRSDPNLKKQFLMAAISRFHQEMRARFTNLQRRQRRHDGVSTESAAGESQVGDYLAGDEAAPGQSGDRPSSPGVLTDRLDQARSRAEQIANDKKEKANQAVVREQTVQERLGVVGAHLRGLADEIRNLGSDISIYLRKADQNVEQHWPPRSDAGFRDWVLKNRFKGKMPNNPQSFEAEVEKQKQNFQSRRQYNFVAAEKVKTYTDAVSAALKSMDNPNDPQGRKSLENLVTRMVRRERGELNDPDSFSRPGNVPDLDPNKSFKPTGDPEAADVWDRSTGYTPSAGADASQFNRATMYEIVGEDEFKNLLQQRVQRLVNSNSARLQGAGKHLFDNMGGRPKHDMRQDFPMWGPFLLLPEVQKRYPLPVRRLLIDMMPLRGEYATGKDKPGAAWSLLYHAARGELHKAPGQVGYNAKDPQGKPVMSADAMNKVRQMQQIARTNIGLRGIKHRWDKLDRAKQQAEGMKSQIAAMNARNVMLKVAEVDTSYIDVVIARIDAEMERECDLFFSYLRAA